MLVLTKITVGTALRLIAWTSGPCCNIQLQTSFVLHMSYTCLTDFVHPRELWRSGGMYFPSFTQSVWEKQCKWLCGDKLLSNLGLICRPHLCIAVFPLYIVSILKRCQCCFYKHRVKHCIKHIIAKTMTIKQTDILIKPNSPLNP